MKDNPKNKQGQGGGPKTPTGKLIAAQNAKTHGITSGSLQSDQEKLDKEALINSLVEYYPSSNPLLQLQIDRIAQITIQLGRLNRAMDAEHFKAKAKATITDHIFNELKFTATDIEKLLTRDLRPNNDLEHLIRLTAEFIGINMEDVKDKTRYLELMPYFMGYLKDQADKKELSFKAFIDREINDEPKNIQKFIIDTGIDRHIIDSEPASPDRPPFMGKSLEESMREVTLDDIEKIIHAYAKKKEAETQSLEKIQLYEAIKPFITDAAMPDTETMDKLMRYQTSLNNQLSKMMGELIRLSELENRRVSE